MPVTFVKARRAHSMPSRFVLPTEEMGQYEDVDGNRRRSAPTRPAGMLFPLTEEGTYGVPPAPAPVYIPRQKKTKTYSSYSVDPKCNVHSEKLAKAEKDHGDDHIRRPARRSFAAPLQPRFTPERKVSADSGLNYNSRPAANTRPVAMPPRDTTNLYRSNYKPEPGYSAKSWTSSSSTTSSVGSGGHHAPIPAYKGNVNRDSRDSRDNSNRYVSSSSYVSSSTGYSRFRRSNLKDTSFEENEEYMYEENNGRPSISLEAMRKPHFDDWDLKGGVLGLANRMWSDTRKRQESFMQSTGHFLREDKYGPHIM